MVLDVHYLSTTEVDKINQGIAWGRTILRQKYWWTFNKKFLPVTWSSADSFKATQLQHKYEQEGNITSTYTKLVNSSFSESMGWWRWWLEACRFSRAHNLPSVDKYRYFPHVLATCTCIIDRVWGYDGWIWRMLTKFFFAFVQNSDNGCPKSAKISSELFFIPKQLRNSSLNVSLEASHSHTQQITFTTLSKYQKLWCRA